MQDSDKLITSGEPNVDLVLQEYQQASPLGEGLFDANYCENVRRNLWPGQSPDGRRWDEWSPDGEPAQPWNGASDTRVAGVDGTINDAVALGMAAFRRAEIRADTVNPESADLLGPLGAYAHWLVRKRYRRALELEAELSLQYAGEYGYCVAYVGWERELSKRRVSITLEELAMLAQQVPEFAGLAEQIMQYPDLDAQSAEAIVALYKLYVVQEMAGKGFFEDELDDNNLLKLNLSTAKRFVRELREEGKCSIPMPYVCKNRPLVYVCRPYHEFLCARGTTDLQSSAILFLRRTFTKAELDAKEQEGWDRAWIDEAKKTAGALSMWGNPSGQPTVSPTNMTGASKVVGGVRWYRLTQAQYDRVEVVYAFRRATDENGVSEIYQTIFSPHVIKGDTGKDLFAKHELLDDAHGEYPFEVLKRENLGRGLTESRSVSEVGGTWQMEEKGQRDMLFNRAQLETLPPLRVPKLGGVDYRVGPGAQVPISPNQRESFGRLFEMGPAPALALEIIQLLGKQRDDYFGNFNLELPPAKTAAKQEKRAGDFFSFWGRIFLKMTALTVQYNPQEIVRVSGSPLLARLEPRAVMEELDLGLAFDVMELDQEYLLKKLTVIAKELLPLDVTGTIDRNALMTIAVRMIDSRLADKILLDRGAASQKVFDDVMGQTVKMAAGNEAQYVENDPTAPMKLQFLNQIVANNPKYQQLMQQDERFRALLENYAKSLQMSVMQQQNAQVGRIGVKQLGSENG
jgi:hypothetical protein